MLLLTAFANKYDERHKQLESHPCPRIRPCVKQKAGF